MNQMLTIPAYAKLNLALDITGKRGDGYHLMHMVMQTVDLCDTLELKKIESGISFYCDDASIPCDEGNIAWRAADAFFAASGISGGVAVALHKAIPHEAGLAGGSADAAAVLKGLNQMHGEPFSISELCRLGETLGADVPYCIVGGTAEVEGIGEKVTPLVPLPDCFFVIVKPEEGISTREAFRQIDRREELYHPNVAAMVGAIARQNLKQTIRYLGNVFEQVCTVEEVFTIKERLLSLGALGALMSGSGSAVFGVFSSYDQAQNAIAVLAEQYSSVYLTKPVR